MVPPAIVALALHLALAVVLAAGAVFAARQLLAYVARRDTEEKGAFLPARGALLLVGVTFVAVIVVAWGQPLAPPALARAVWTAALAVIFVVDLRVRYILDVFTGPLAVLALVAAALWPHPTLGEAVGGGLIGLAVFSLFYGLGLLLFRRPAIGLGDVKLAALLGLMVGAPSIVNAIFIGAVVGGVASVLLILYQRIKLGDMPAYGTYMVLGGYAALLHAAGWW